MADRNDTPRADHITIVMGGDLGLGGSGQPVRPHGAMKHGRLIPWQELTTGISDLVTGDINFANLETVVTDSNKLPASSKTFTFKSHPNGVRHLVELGFNVFSTANNHVVDFGRSGMRESMAHLNNLKSVGLLAAPGMGLTRKEAGQPSIVSVKGEKFAVSALGIGGRPPTGNDFGILGYRSTEDFSDIVGWLTETPQAYRILSVHYGAELALRPSRTDTKKLRDQALREAGIDLVIGHHAHVAAGVQEIDGKLVFYGLGNLLHPGMQNMDKFGRCRDYGIVAKLHLTKGQDDRLRASAIEVWPLQSMHATPRVMSAEEARRRIAVLNGLAKGLDHQSSGARGVRFSSRDDGSGLACLEGGADLGGEIGEQCRAWSPPVSNDRKSVFTGCDQAPVGLAKRQGQRSAIADGSAGHIHKAPADNAKRYRRLFRQAFGE